MPRLKSAAFGPPPSLNIFVPNTMSVRMLGTLGHVRTKGLKSQRNLQYMPPSNRGRMWQMKFVMKMEKVYKKIFVSGETKGKNTGKIPCLEQVIFGVKKKQTV